MNVDGLNKAELRRLLRERRIFLSGGEEGARRSRRMQERLTASDLWRGSRAVALYVSVRGEPGTELLLREAWNSGMTVFLPRCRSGEKGVMDMIACAGPEKLENSRFGIPEPRLEEHSRLLSAEELSDPHTLVVVPALAFDREGFRLGYGGGYYDRFLAGARCMSVGLAYHELLLEHLPHDVWDRPAGAVCTEEELLCL